MSSNQVRESNREDRMSLSNRKTVTGQVVSNSMDKSVVVQINRRLKHPVYGKFITKSTKFVAHDEKNECQLGDTIKIVESRPLSKTKKWRLVEVISKVELI